MTDLIHNVNSPDEIVSAAANLRQSLEADVSPNAVIAVLDSWAKSLDNRDLDDIHGIVFLRIWLRRGSLASIVTRVVGHWPAGNIEIQPALSMTCALLGGNAALVRIPSGLVDQTRRLAAKLVQSDPCGLLTRRICMVAFAHDRHDLQEAMARVVDGAMLWGGQEAVLQIRGLPLDRK